MAKFYVDFTNATIGLNASTLQKAKNEAGEYIKHCVQGEIYLLDAKLKKLMIYDKWGALWIKLSK